MYSLKISIFIWRKGQTHYDEDVLQLDEVYRENNTLLHEIKDIMSGASQWATSNKGKLLRRKCWLKKNKNTSCWTWERTGKYNSLSWDTGESLFTNCWFRRTGQFPGHSCTKRAFNLTCNGRKEGPWTRSCFC